jgi:hypothetical protein
MLLDYSMERTSRKGEAASLALHLVWEKWAGRRKEKEFGACARGLS